MTPRAAIASLAVCAAGLTACGRRSVEPFPAGSLVVTQVPASAGEPSAAGSVLDARYPQGSRVVLAVPPVGPANVRVLSEGLSAAGEPFVTPDGSRVLFSGRKSARDPWQIHEAVASGGPPRALTAMPEGAASPTLLADGSVVFVSPAPRTGDGWFPAKPAALWALSPADKAPRKLTFGSSSAVDPTVLADGRILFVSATPTGTSPATGPPAVSLFTIYNDGTGVSPYACQHDGAGVVGRPRELPGGRVAFLSRPVETPAGGGEPEVVFAAAPWKSRARLAAGGPGVCRSLERGEGSSLLASAEARRAGRSGWGIFRLSADPPSAAEPVFHDPAWNEVEAVRVEPRRKPMGRISTINAAKKTGVVFAIDVNHTTYEPAALAARIRILTSVDGGRVVPLGEVPVQPDGSFLAEVPADVPLGFEALDRDGTVVRRLPPSVWVRPGENRGCIGCHEPHGLAPRNRRPLAVKLPPVSVGFAGGDAKAGGAR